MTQRVLRSYRYLEPNTILNKKGHNFWKYFSCDSQYSWRAKRWLKLACFCCYRHTKYSPSTNYCEIVINWIFALRRISVQRDPLCARINFQWETTALSTKICSFLKPLVNATRSTWWLPCCVDIVRRSREIYGNEM